MPSIRHRKRASDQRPVACMYRERCCILLSIVDYGLIHLDPNADNGPAFGLACRIAHSVLLYQTFWRCAWFHCLLTLSYAVAYPKGNFASGRAEDIVSFSRKFGSESQIFVKKVRKVPCCRRRNRLLCLARGRNNLHRITHIIALRPGHAAVAAQSCDTP